MTGHDDDATQPVGASDELVEELRAEIVAVRSMPQLLADINRMLADADQDPDGEDTSWPT